MDEKKVAFVTGANRGLGFETARELGERGIAVVLGARDPLKGEEAAIALRAKGVDAEAIRYDAADSATEREVADFFERHHGRLDILVNNAGTMKETMGAPNTSATISPTDLRETFETNLFAVVSLTQALLPLIRKAPAGRIVNLSSVLGSLTLQSDPKSPLVSNKLFAYDASKTALNAFTVHLAALLRDTPIKVNSAHPGWVRTDMGGARAPDRPGGGRADERPTRDPPGRRPDRRLLPPRQAAALVSLSRTSPLSGCGPHAAVR